MIPLFIYAHLPKQHVAETSAGTSDWKLTREEIESLCRLARTTEELRALQKLVAITEGASGWPD